MLRIHGKFVRFTLKMNSCDFDTKIYEKKQTDPIQDGPT